MNLTNITKSAIDTLFRLGGEFVKDVTYVRPPGPNPGTGQVAGAEVRVGAKAIVPSYAPAGFALRNRGTARVVFKAADLAGISVPAAGDYIVLPDGTRLDVTTARIDVTAQIWLFDTEESPGEDYGDLTAHGASADYGDLTAHTSEEDYGILFQQ
jgi:hypothetical protein